MPKISELEDVTNLSDGCCFPMVSHEETRKLSYGDLKERLTEDGFSDIVVEANPQGTATETLTKIKVDDIIYEIEEGGTEVIPNPILEGDENALTSIQIGEDKFKVESASSADEVSIVPPTGLESTNVQDIVEEMYEDIPIKVELTQAQYDALPDSKLTDGIDYYITDEDGYEGIIDDEITGEASTWSSEKIDGELDTIKTSLNSVNVELPTPTNGTFYNSFLTRMGNVVDVSLVYTATNTTSNPFYTLPIKSVKTNYFMIFDVTNGTVHGHGYVDVVGALRCGKAFTVGHQYIISFTYLAE